MKNNRLLGVGLGGFAFTAICCVTPLLVVLVSALGFSALVGWLDYVLFPALAVFAGITLYALWRRWGKQTT